MSRFALAAAAVALFAAAPARAHVGASVAVARFTNPAQPGIANGTPLDTVTPLPFGFASADASFTVKWDDGDTDPTGRFTFYYLDHEPTFQVSVDDIINGLGTLVPDTLNQNGGYFASCTCSMDLGVTCPPDVRDPNGNCANQLTWNTSALPRGTWWLVAVNTDPPFHTYNASDAPVLVAHGTDPLPPAAIIARPDGFGAWDQSYQLQWLATGKAPLRFALAYGIEDTGKALTPVGTVADPLPTTMNADGTLGYGWDLSSLMNNTSYFVRLTVTDADGFSTFTDSHFGVTIFRQGGTGGVDLAVAPAPPPARHGCDVEPGASTSGALASTLFAFAAAALVLLVARRRG